jgi:hypothetical protein
MGRTPTGRTEILYVRITEANAAFIRRLVGMQKKSLSAFVDNYITNYRNRRNALRNKGRTRPDRVPGDSNKE